MIYQYVVTLRNTRARYLDRISLWLLLMSEIAFLSTIFYDTVRNIYVFLGFALVIICMAAYNLVLHKQNPGKTVYYSHALFIAAIGWVFLQGWLFIPLAFMGLFERQAKRQLEIGFSDDTVVINSLFRRKYHWTDFNNVLLKDDLLTLDFKNNRLLQRETIDEEGDAEEDEFNDYCRGQLAKAHSVLN